jgi:hypothetical protein
MTNLIQPILEDYKERLRKKGKIINEDSDFSKAYAERMTKAMTLEIDFSELSEKQKEITPEIYKKFWVQ